MKLRFILRDGERVLQQYTIDPVLFRRVWEDVPLVKWEDVPTETETVGGFKIRTDEKLKPGEFRFEYPCSNVSTEKSCTDSMTIRKSETLSEEDMRSMLRYSSYQHYPSCGKSQSDSDTSEP